MIKVLSKQSKISKEEPSMKHEQFEYIIIQLALCTKKEEKPLRHSRAYSTWYYLLCKCIRTYPASGTWAVVRKMRNGPSGNSGLCYKPQKRGISKNTIGAESRKPTPAALDSGSAMDSGSVKMYGNGHSFNDSLKISP